MSEITTIEPQKKDPKRVNIFLNGQFAFGLSLEQKFEAKLKVGQTLTETQVKELIEKDQVGRLLDKAFLFLSYRPRSEREIRDQLLRKGKLSDLNTEAEKQAYQDSVEKVIIQLKKYDQVDDLAFAQWWVEQRLKFSPRGVHLLKLELFQKGVPREVVDQVMENSGIESTVTSEDGALKIAEKKINLYRNLDRTQFRQKMGQFLARRGYDWDLVTRVVDILEKKR